MSVRRKLIAGNWKMNGLLADGRARAAALAEKMAAAQAAGGVRFDMAICPPATLLWPIREVLAGSAIALGGQDCHFAEKGAHTGDISAAMLADIGCRYVILGHSERRQDHHETDELVARKVRAAHGAGLIAIVCVGETAAERDQGQAGAVVARQLAGSLPEGVEAANTVIAYEPVWAIGTGKTATAADVAAMHAHIRAELAGKVADPQAVRILYGGSVKPDNAAELLALADVDGALVGGASLDPDGFWAIAQTCR